MPGAVAGGPCVVPPSDEPEPALEPAPVSPVFGGGVGVGGGALWQATTRAGRAARSMPLSSRSSGATVKASMMFVLAVLARRAGMVRAIARVGRTFVVVARRVVVARFVAVLASVVVAAIVGVGGLARLTIIGG